LSRSPAIDTANDIVYVTSTTEGKIRAFDRHSMDLLGALAVGHGPRIPYYSASTDKLFANSSLAYYSWDADELAQRFRGDE
jgi:hypothetical protein